ncbi:MAG: CPBP family intramembrane metalloprotease [Tannerella sp.]|jgi:membrane protease YdiL (CAAX protease family)|nr:CPBP family intramembrane metalloprotease [Tannerella sp.]
MKNVAMIKGIYAGRSVFFQFGVLTFLVLTGFFMASTVSYVLLAVSGQAGVGMESVVYVQCVQLLASAFTFLFPAVATVWLCSEQPAAFFGSGRVPGVRLAAWIAAATLLISPAVSLTGYFNMQMQLPEFMAPLEQYMRDAEKSTAEVIAKMLQREGFLPLLANLAVIAVAAAVCEEFLFRGTILGLLGRKMRSPHVAIWIVAVIFSAIHFQFYGFVPRMLLGVFLGYLMRWTGSIWAPVFAHFLYNAVAVAGMSNDLLKDSVFFTDNPDAGDMGWFSVVSAVTLIAFFGCMRVIRRTGLNGE